MGARPRSAETARSRANAVRPYKLRGTVVLRRRCLADYLAFIAFFMAFFANFSLTVSFGLLFFDTLT